LRYLALVKYGAMDNIERFEFADSSLQVGDPVVIRTRRGVEWGEMVSKLGEVDEKSDKRRNVTGEILRKCTEDDRVHKEEIEEKERKEYKVCKDLIRQYKLPMKLVSVEHLLGGHKIIFFFLADGRVDFRKLVKTLAQKYKTRIEMRQIGTRDEARLLGRFGQCGRELCCRKFMHELKPVPMKMAKRQKSTLDPAKISGRCGRLKCCLRFEDKLYQEFKKTLPRRGARVKTSAGEGVVQSRKVLQQTVVVKLGEGNKQSFPVDEIEVVKD